MWVFETGDADEAHDFHVRAYADNRMAMADIDERFRFRVARQDGGSFYFDEYRNTMDARFSVDPIGHIIVARLQSGHYERTVARADGERFQPGDTFLIADPELPWSCHARDTRLQLIGLDTDFVTRIAGVNRLHVAGYRPPTPALARRWEQVLAFVAAGWLMTGDEDGAGGGGGSDGAVGDPASGSAIHTRTYDHPLLSAGVSQLLAAVFLSVFPTDVVTEPSAVDRRDAHPRTVRRAIAFIEANPDRDISVAEIAEAASVTTRAVQLAFRRYLGTTPTAYLKQVRLHEAHRELLNADPARGDRVVRVAAHWGFTSMSRFAADYKSTFGEPPSRTLRRVANL